MRFIKVVSSSAPGGRYRRGKHIMADLRCRDQWMAVMAAMRKGFQL
jgi:hypothetical protein